jgi:formylmethanofuran dehydrogenase subunit E
MSREETTEWLLTAPFEEVFAVTDVKVPYPEYQRGPGEVICSVCGEKVLENLIHDRNGEFVCCDCL